MQNGHFQKYAFALIFSHELNFRGEYSVSESVDYIKSYLYMLVETFRQNDLLYLLWTKNNHIEMLKKITVYYIYIPLCVAALILKVI